MMTHSGGPEILSTPATRPPGTTCPAIAAGLNDLLEKDWKTR